MAMTESARQQQKFIVDFLANTDDSVEQKRVTRENAEVRRKSTECFYFILGGVTDMDFLNARVIDRRLDAQILNTHERQQVYLAVDELLGGTGGGDMGDDRTLCREFGFDPDTLPN